MATSTRSFGTSKREGHDASGMFSQIAQRLCAYGLSHEDIIKALLDNAGPSLFVNGEVTSVGAYIAEHFSAAGGRLDEEARDHLVDFLQSVGNTEEQIDYWLSYSVELTAFEDETLESVIETEIILARLLEQIR